MARRITQIIKDMADAVREKTGKTEKIIGKDIPDEILSIVAGSPYPAGTYFNSFDETYGWVKDITMFGEILADNLEVTSKELMMDRAKTIRLDGIKKMPAYFLGRQRSVGPKCTTLYLCDELEEIGEYAFSSNKTITDIILPDGRKNTIPETVTVIPKNCFYYCNALSSPIVLHDNITEVGDMAFYLSKSIKNAELPTKLKTIGNQAFMQQSFPFTKIPATVETIGTQAFYGNPALTEITFEGIPKTIGNAFSGCTGLTKINVPWAEGAIDGAPWGASNATINYNYKG